jgi:hypothetical protein
MQSASAHYSLRLGPRLRRSRRRVLGRWLAAAMIAGLAAAAFVVWGPIGLGSGPLTVYGPSGGQILGPRNQAWGMMVPVLAGESGAVIDQVTVAGGDGYRGPRVLSILEVADRPGQCGGTFPWEGSQSILSTCAIGGLHRLIGIRLPGDNPGVIMVIKVGPPASGSSCWTVTAVAVHYHVGIRHYTVTSPGNFAACKTAAQEHNADLALGQPS